MKKFGLDLNFTQIRKRIEVEKQQYRPGEWAKIVGVSPNIISNVHGRTQQRPSLEYIIAVSMATKKTVDYYLWGDLSKNQKDSNFLNRFKNQEAALRNIESLIWIEKESEGLYKEVSQHIQTVQKTAKTLKEERKK